MNYHNQNEELEEDPSEIEQDYNLKKNMMIHIEGEDNMMLDDEDDNEDLKLDKEVKVFLEDLKKIGPYSKQILNYSYPPLLYQRGDDEDEEEEDDDEGEGKGGQLPDFGPVLDEDEDKDI